MKRFVSLLLLVSTCLTSLETIPSDFIPSAAGFKANLVKLAHYAKQHGISRNIIKHHLLTAQYQNKVIQHDQYQPELILGYKRYLALFVTKTRVNNGILFFNQHRNLLKAISKKYHVQPQYLVALLGAESNYGKTMGNFPIVDALATLAYADGRHLFYQRELLSALKILQNNPRDKLKLLCSWAGAMGQCQFMPDIYLTYAVSYDNYGQPNIWTNAADALASTANFVHHLGWTDKQGVAFQVKLPVNFSLDQLGRSSPRTISAWKKLGIVSYTGQPFPRWPGKLVIIVTQGSPLHAYLVSSNFFVLLRWNDAYLYALAINQIAKHIAKDQLITSTQTMTYHYTAKAKQEHPKPNYLQLRAKLQQQWHRYLNFSLYRFYFDRELFWI